MSDDNVTDQKTDVVEKSVAAIEESRFSKKEKRIDYQNTNNRMKDSQEIVSKKDTVTVYNPTSIILEADFGRDKSVRIPPLSNVELNRDLLDNPGFDAIKQFVKIF